MENNITEQLRDIKPLVEIDDYSVYLYWALWLLGLAVVGIIIYWSIRKYMTLKKVNLEKLNLEKMDEIDWSDSKRAAYEATEYGRFLANDERREGLYQDVVLALEKYKYQESVPNMDAKDMAVFELYKRVCHESV